MIANVFEVFSDSFCNNWTHEYSNRDVKDKAKIIVMYLLFILKSV